jgi:polysaccharide deacetylase family protein (PEP-CTERM system associated)
MTAGAAQTPVLLTIEVEDYFHVGKFDRLIARDKWYRFEPRIERNTRAALDLLERHRVRATFFVLGWVAERMPELVRELTTRGHEVASMGYDHRTIAEMTPGSFREDLARSREVLERASGRRIVGHRVPHYLGPADLWALDVLAEEGYAYDSSLKPIFRRFAREPWRRTLHRHTAGESSLWEVPLSSWHFGVSIPIAGAGYFRHFPHGLVRSAVRSWLRTQSAPFVMYFRVWELDPDQPRIGTAPLLSRLRHYRNIEKMPRILEDYFREHRVTSIADHLALDTTPRATAETASPRPEPPAVSAGPALAGCTPVTIVVPCFNEEPALGYLANTLRSVQSSLSDRYSLRLVFVDDGSTDGTWAALQRVFAPWPNAALVRHDRNRGVATAILSGLRAAETEVVCSIDCDCTYDPHELGVMIPLLSEGVDLVTASPYHPLGAVRNIPAWRLTLSRGASFLYRRVSRQKLWTYTSCFRVYRRSALADLEVREGGFLGVAETLGLLDLRGARVVEHPAVLEVRILGHSKMKALRAVAGHLALLGRLAAMRISGRRSRPRPRAGEVGGRRPVRGDT